MYARLCSFRGKEILGETLQYTPGFVYRNFFCGIQATGDRHFDGFTIPAMNQHCQRCPAVSAHPEHHKFQCHPVPGFHGSCRA